QLAAPELIAEYVREVHRYRHALNETEGARRRPIERSLAKTTGAIARVVHLLETGTATRALRDRLVALEAERERLQAQMAAVPAPPIELHPNAAENYRRQVADLKRTLGGLDPERRAEAAATMRRLVEKIVIKPTGAYKPA